MGLDTTLNITGAAMQKRYMGINIRKFGNLASATISAETGFYEDAANHKDWIAVKRETVEIGNDLLAILMTMKPSNLGLAPDQPTVTMLETVVYGVISGQIPTHANVTINIKDEQGKPVSAGIKLKTSYGSYIYDGAFNFKSTHIFDRSFPPMLGVVIEASAPGYLPTTKVVSTWYKDRTTDVIMKKAPEEATTTTLTPPTSTGETTTTIKVDSP